MRTTGFELETNQDRYTRDIDTDRTVRGLIGHDWLETSVRRVSLRHRIHIRIAFWLWKPVGNRMRDTKRSNPENGNAASLTRKAA